MRITGLYVYPVKACRALALDETALDALGLVNDRRFVFVGEDGRALTQREHPLLATIRPGLEPDSLRLDCGGLVEIELALRDFAEPTAVDVWGQRVPGRAAAGNRSAAVADYLGARLRLVALEAGVPRSFVDSRPLLVVTSGMLSALDLPGLRMDRFRPNIVLEGTHEVPPALEGNSIRLERDKPCARCEVTTIDQTSGARRGPEPLRTLSERFGGNFGVYYRVARAGPLRRGELLKPS